MATITTQRKGVGRLFLSFILAIPAAVGLIWDEVLLAGPIIFLVEVLGFWGGYFLFCLIWAGLGILLLEVWLRTEPWVKTHIFKRRGEISTKPADAEKPKNWRERFALRLANVARILGILAAAVLLGPVFAWPIFKLFGYNRRQVLGFTILAAFIFGSIWVPFYAGIWSFGLSKVI